MMRQVILLCAGKKNLDVCLQLPVLMVLRHVALTLDSLRRVVGKIKRFALKSKEEKKKSTPGLCEDLQVFGGLVVNPVSDNILNLLSETIYNRIVGQMQYIHFEIAAKHLKTLVHSHGGRPR